ncbi:hypothetical protein ACVBEF_05870 [Glaciimonas sp. GG7]
MINNIFYIRFFVIPVTPPLSPTIPRSFFNEPSSTVQSISIQPGKEPTNDELISLIEKKGTFSDIETFVNNFMKFNFEDAFEYRLSDNHADIKDCFSQNQLGLKIGHWRDFYEEICDAFRESRKKIEGDVKENLITYIQQHEISDRDEVFSDFEDHFNVLMDDAYGDCTRRCTDEYLNSDTKTDSDSDS